MSEVFTVTEPDWKLSPLTGMTRKHWLLAAEHLLSGIFSHIASMDEPVVMPRAECQVTYPHKNAEPAQHELEIRSERFEGLARSLFIAAPLLKNKPDLILHGLPVASYYKNHILRACSSSDSLSVGSYSDLQKIADAEGSFRTYQQTVETCALVIALEVSKEVIWDTYSQKEKDCIADFLSTYADAPTVPQNWRLFNMLVMAFLAKNGYRINKAVMFDHAAAILNYYVGDGWYRDGQSFDYYSCWAFNVYAPLWNQWYGYQEAPDIAGAFEEHSLKLMESFPAMFDRKAFVTMWGRSCVYRCALASAFEGALSLPGAAAKIDCGLARRICSGALLQFISRPDFYFQGIPTMGFYRQFSPLVQGYSCAESPFWLGKIFLCLALPPEHPFWTEKENNGFWDEAGEDVRTSVLNGPGLCITNHGKNGSTIFRTGKVVKQSDDRHGVWNYGKLCYSSDYPWEAVDESMQYLLTDESSGKRQLANVTLWHGQKDGVLYRRQFFDYRLQAETHWMYALNLADIALPSGILRCDRLRLFRTPVSLTLGSFGFPDTATEVFERQENPACAWKRPKALSSEPAKALVLKGYDSQGREKQLAMTVWCGWQGLELVHSQDTNPDSEKSLFILASSRRSRLYDSSEGYLFISQVITKESHEDFTEEELFPIAALELSDGMQTGGYGKMTLRLKSGKSYPVDFSGMEASLLL